MIPWAHQTRTVNDVLGAFDAGVRRVAFTIPTGGGKTWCLEELVRRFLPLPVALYTDRIFLREQISRDFEAAGIPHGVRAAGAEDMREMAFQICSIQTEHRRAVKRKLADWPLHPAKLVLVDEGHKQTGDSAKAVWQWHLDQGAYLAFSTATPFDMKDVCDKLVVGATNSELRRCGALVWADHFGPDEPDWREFKLAKKVRLDDGGWGTEPDLDVPITEAVNRVAMSAPRVFASVWKEFGKLNPDLKPFMGFGPDVEGSLFYAQAFSEKGVRCAHIDGDHVWIDGELHPSTQDLREELLAESKAGRLVGIWNRFVLREGINAPWIAHMILAAVFGSLQSYLQSVGRGLRSYPGLERVTIQDHGGNWWRHGSANEDRVWVLEDTARSVANRRADAFRYPDPTKPPKEPFRCPQCARIWVSRKVCVCGYLLENRKVSRPVLCSDGTLREMQGAIFKPRRVYKPDNGPTQWGLMYCRSFYERGHRTFRQAEAQFAREHDFAWPDRSWPCMPRDAGNLNDFIHRVRFEDLTSVPDWVRPKVDAALRKNAEDEAKAAADAAKAAEEAATPNLFDESVGAQ